MSPEQTAQTRATILQLLSNMASAKEIRQYLQRFSDLKKSRFALIKVGGAILRDELDALSSSLAFLQRVGLTPIVVHGAGPQLNDALAAEGIETNTKNGLRVTSPDVLRVARRVFAEQNLALVESLHALSVRAQGLTGGVLEARLVDEAGLGLVGEVTAVHEDAVLSSVRAGVIPVLASLGETATGQIVNINADQAAQHLVRHFEPYKIVFLTGTGGILDEHGALISSINLATDEERLMNAPWLHSGMRLKLQEIAALLRDLPTTSSVSITKPEQLPKELFTHQGAGTLVRKGEAVLALRSWDDVDKPRLRALVEESFGGALDDAYFANTPLATLYVAESYRAAAIVTVVDGLANLDKFVAADAARGEGLARACWDKMREEHPRLFWRARAQNPINAFYVEQADGFVRGETWNVYWCGLTDMADIARCVEAGRSRPATVQRGA